jgi:UDP-N-acetylmuramyl pentapeptide synthase
MSPLWSAAELAAVFGQPCAFEATGVSFDTRTLAPGDLFVALADARDGHDFVAEAFAKGAAGALVSRPMPGAVLLVDDTLEGLRRLAAAGRARSDQGNAAPHAVRLRQHPCRLGELQQPYRRAADAGLFAGGAKIRGL